MARAAAAETGLAKYEPFIVPSKNFPAMLYCALTGQLIAKSLDAIKLHMKGKKFERAKGERGDDDETKGGVCDAHCTRTRRGGGDDGKESAVPQTALSPPRTGRPHPTPHIHTERFTADEQELKPEPSLESFGIRLPKGDAAGAAAEGEGGAGEEGAAAEGEGAGGEGGIWVPEGVESSEDEEEGEGMDDDDDDDDDASGSGSGGEGGGDEEMAEGGSGGGDEDAAAAEAPAAAKQQQQQQQPAKQAKAGKPQKQQKQKQKQQQKGGSGAAAAGGKDKAAAAAKAKKRNPQKPSAAKKQRH